MHSLQCVLEFQSVHTQWRSREVSKRRHAPRGTVLGSVSAHFTQTLKLVFQQKFRPNVPKNAHFLEKGCKIAAEPEGSVPEPPSASSSWVFRPPPDSRVVTPTYRCL